MEYFCYDFMRKELEDYLENTKNIQTLCKSIRAVFYHEPKYWNFNQETSKKYTESFLFYKVVNKRIDTKSKLCLRLNEYQSKYKKFNVHMIKYNHLTVKYREIGRQTVTWFNLSPPDSNHQK
jgi:hypothetical protein